ncbi:Rpe Pentose-5-phosphate-3-epimerase [Candidatus Nanopelagicaceae bacterium]
MSGHIRITPSILNADFSRLDQEIAKIGSVSDFIHLDVMDNIFVPNFTFDFSTASKIIASSPVPIDAHLMVADVDQIAIDYAEAGAASVTIHAEATTNISATLKGIKSHGARAALAVKPGTAIEGYEEFVGEIDMFLIMTVEPGFGGQKFMESMMEKVRRTREMIGSRPIWLQVDGGITLETIEIAVEAGADTFVAGSAVFKAEDPAQMVIALRERALSSKLHP